MQNLIRYFINLFDKISNRKVINELKKYFINDINVFFDVGGHHGETTIWFSKFFKIKKIYIFEPNFDSFNILNFIMINIEDLKNLLLKFIISPLETKTKKQT